MTIHKTLNQVHSLDDAYIVYVNKNGYLDTYSVPYTHNGSLAYLNFTRNDIGFETVYTAETEGIMLLAEIVKTEVSQNIKAPNNTMVREFRLLPRYHHDMGQTSIEYLSSKGIEFNNATRQS